MKTKGLAEKFLQKARAAQVEIRHQPINSFHSLFQVQELSERDELAIEKILIDGYVPAQFIEEAVESDINEVKRITKELKAIQRQEVVLIGERIFAARKIFDQEKYREKSFKEWLELMFGSFKSGYNYLNFYKLYLAIPDSLKINLKEMPARAAYILASKDAPIEKKAEIIKNHALEAAKDLILIIQEALGTGQGGKSKKQPGIDKILDSLKNGALVVRQLREQLDEGQKKRVREIIKILERASV